MMDLNGSTRSCTLLRPSPTQGLCPRRHVNFSTMKDSYKSYSLPQQILAGSFKLPAKPKGHGFHQCVSVGSNLTQESSTTKMPPLKPVMAMCSQITTEAWERANNAVYRRAEMNRRRAEMYRLETCRLIQSNDKFTWRTHCDTNKRISERLADISFWIEEVRQEIGQLIKDTEALRGLKMRLHGAIADTEGPLQIALECVSHRQKRMGPDLVNDDVEKELQQEVAVIMSCREQLEKIREKVRKQLEANRRAQHALEKELNDKHLAHHIDTKCQKLNHCGTSVNYYPNLSWLDQSVSVPATWAQFSEDNLLQSQTERVQTQRAREEVKALLESTSAAMRCQGNKVNTAFSTRISKTAQAKDRLQKHLAMTLQEIFHTERITAELERAINSKRAPLKVAQSRLEERMKRPNMELCIDPPHTRLLSEVESIQDTVSALTHRLSETQDALQQLADSKSFLEQELFVKAHSLFIDQERCLGLRKTHTHTCST